MDFYSTRDQNNRVNGCQAVISGIAQDGGLFLPCELPRYTGEQLKQLGDLSYVELASKVLFEFFPEIGEQKLKWACQAAYAPE